MLYKYIYIIYIKQLYNGRTFDYRFRKEVRSETIKNSYMCD